MIRVLHALSRLLAALPLSAAQAVGAAAGWFLGSVVRHRRREAAGALARCLPERPAAERRRILAAMYRHLGMTLVEQLRISVAGLRDFEDRIDIHGAEHLRAAAAAGGGTLALMAHLGNWELCGYCTRLIERPVSVVVKRMRNPQLEVYLTRTRQRMNLRMLPAVTSFRECARVLKDGEFLAIILDQNTKRSRGVFVEFFGRPACTTTGLAVLAARQQVPILPIFVLRRPGQRFDLIIQDPIPPPPDTRPASLQAATQHYTRIIEGMVREHPEQWIWIHRRWRTQPKPQPAAPPRPS